MLNRKKYFEKGIDFCSGKTKLVNSFVTNVALIFSPVTTAFKNKNIIYGTISILVAFNCFC